MSDEKIPLKKPSEVPDLKTEKEAREFWDTHEVTEDYLDLAGTSAEKPCRPSD